MHIIVVGCGRVGSGLAVSLEEQGHSVAIIDRNPKAFRRLGGFAGLRVVGQGFDRETLIEAGAERADAFASVTSGDNSNILAARIAKENFQIPSVVARIYDPKRAAIYQRLGIATVATVAWTTEQVRRQLFSDSINDWTDQSGTLNFVERRLPPSWAGRKLSEFQSGDEFRLVAVARAGVARLVETDLIGQEGDVLHVMVRTDAIEKLEAVLTGPQGGH
jgi:trk system potassium uptake protein